MKKELKIFFTALMFYTRIPVPKSAGYSDENLNKATRYFPFIGVIVGGIGAGIYIAARIVFPELIAILLSMIATIYATGAFHEDGFADFCDGFGGGNTKEKILEIMKDSRIGTYGSIGLILILSLKFFTLLNIEIEYLPIVIICGHTFSRIFPVFMIYALPYAREDLSSKVKPIGHKGSIAGFIMALVTVLVIIGLLPWFSLLIVVPVTAMVYFIFKRYIMRRLGGYSGDVLGALQQITEVLFYIAFLYYQNNIK